MQVNNNRLNILLKYNLLKKEAFCDTSHYQIIYTMLKSKS